MGSGGNPLPKRSKVSLESSGVPAGAAEAARTHTHSQLGNSES